MTLPPPIPEQPIKSSNKRWILWVALGVIVFFIVCGGIYVGVKAIINTGITKGPDHMFGDQHLKTSVALIELHKVRYGKYPEKLSDIKHTGQWDMMHLHSVYYISSKDLQSYYIEVTRGWAGKPEDLALPDDFWQGTGFDPTPKKLKE